MNTLPEHLINNTTTHIKDLIVKLPKNVILNKVYDNNSMNNIFSFLNKDKPELYKHIHVQDYHKK